MLNREWLPQTRQVSFGLSLTTSHSAHKTAFRSATALTMRACDAELSASEPFITEPLQELTLFDGPTTRPNALSIVLFKLDPRRFPIKVHSSIHHHSNVAALFEKLHDFLSLACQLCPA